jgi:hypothetical protein
LDRQNRRQGLAAATRYSRWRLDVCDQEFRRFSRSGQRAGLEGRVSEGLLACGIVCLNGPPGMDLDMQIELFDAARFSLDALVGLAAHAVLAVRMEVTRSAA